MVTSMPGPTVVGSLGASTISGSREHVLELADLGLHEPLLFLGGVVLGVLLEVAVLARHLDLLGDALASRRGELLELGLDAPVGIERECRGGLLPGGTGGPVPQLFGEFGHACECNGDGARPHRARITPG